MRLAGGHTEVGASVSAGIASRHFSYSDPVGRLPRPYNLGIAPMVSVALEAYPLAASNAPVLRDLGFVGHFSRAFALDSKTPEGAKLQTSWTRFGGQVRERLIVQGPHTLELGVYGGADASYFVLSTNAKIAALLPTARTVSLRFGFDARLLVAWRLSLLLGGAYLDTTARGEIYDRFRRPRVGGVDADFGAAVLLAPGVEAQLTGRYTRYFATFRPWWAMPTSRAARSTNRLSLVWEFAMHTDRVTWRWFCASAVALSSLTGCPGELENKERFLVDAGNLDEPDAGMSGEAGVSMGACGNVPTRIFVPSCGGTGCHSATAPQQGLDLASPGVAARVVGVAAKTCTGTLADPANAASSLLYTKLAPTQTCGAPMPLARPPLGDADAACVLAWIAAQ